MRTAQEQRTAMRNLIARRKGETFFDMAHHIYAEINSRQIIDRHAVLSTACDDSLVEHREIVAGIPLANPYPDVADCTLHLSADERDEIEQLTDLIDQLEGGEDWEQGVDLIAEDDFENHAQEKASDDHNASADLDDWPYSCIDWSDAASELQYDYVEGSVDAGTWWIRN